MLFVLTGDFQTGKTRWLQALLSDLSSMGVLVGGVVAPGRWVDHGQAAHTRFEKVGIDNVLLPQGETIAFAHRADLIDERQLQDSCAQSQDAKLGWAISDAALDQVNAHFSYLGASVKEGILPEDIKAKRRLAGEVSARSGLLVVDELGPLELVKNGGLTSAVNVLSQGSSSLFAHALIVVRESLVDVAVERFSDSWGGAHVVFAAPEAAHRIKALFAAA